VPPAPRPPRRSSKARPGPFGTANACRRGGLSERVILFQSIQKSRYVPPLFRSPAGETHPARTCRKAFSVRGPHMSAKRMTHSRRLVRGDNVGKPFERIAVRAPARGHGVTCPDNPAPGGVDRFGRLMPTGFHHSRFLLRRSRESGNPGNGQPTPALDPRFRVDDKMEVCGIHPQGHFSDCGFGHAVPGNEKCVGVV
jgi:hypothetical protein